ncbi:MAG: hypothetical protein JXB88_17445 [Spirochaetales bacterium]|nr:hypothetical protein [Spirochaetales bacterium]
MFVFLFFIAFPVFIFAVNAETTYDSEHYYNTTGNVIFNLSCKELTDILTNYDGYRNWALKGIDGKDSRSRKFIAILTDIIYRQESQKFILVFDVNLFWPFGSKGNNIYFDIRKEYTSTGLLKSIEFELSEPAFLVPRAVLSLQLYEHSIGSRIYFKSRIKLAWFIDLFYTLKGFKKNFEVRIVNIMRNIKSFQRKEKKKMDNAGTEPGPFMKLLKKSPGP